MKKLKTIALAFAGAAMVTACSSSPKTGLDKIVADNIGQEKIISRIDEISSRPSWLQEQTPFRIESGKVLSMGMTTIPADHNLSAAYRIAENNSKALISHSIEQRLDFIFQNAEESTALGTNQAQYIGAEASKLTSNSLKPSKRYWEKVATIGQDGQTTVQYKVFALSEMAEEDFKKAIVDSIRKNQGKQGISADFAKKVDKHWDAFVNANPQPSEQKQ